MSVFDDDPRTRRLKADFEAMKRLKEASSIIDFTSTGDPPERYVVTFKGRGVSRKSEEAPVQIQETHRVELQLGIDYPRSQPYLKWSTEIYHPNIAISGAVCLGGYSTNWVPSLTLDNLCNMLWDMLRFANYDVASPYNYRAAQWAKAQTQWELPLDPRPLRDRAGRTQGSNVIKLEITKPAPKPEARPIPPPAPPKPAPAKEEIFFIDGGDAAPQPPPPPRRVVAPPVRQRPPDDGISFVE